MTTKHNMKNLFRSLSIKWKKAPPMKINIPIDGKYKRCSNITCVIGIILDSTEMVKKNHKIPKDINRYRCNFLMAINKIPTIIKKLIKVLNSKKWWDNGTSWSKFCPLRLFNSSCLHRLGQLNERGSQPDAEGYCILCQTGQLLVFGLCRLWHQLNERGS